MSNTQSGNSFENVSGVITQTSTVDKSKKIINKNNKVSIVIGVVFVAIVVIGLIVLFNKQKPENLIIGRWYTEGTSKEYEFTKDGRLLYLSGLNDVNINYTIDGHRIYLNVNLIWATSTVSADIYVDKEHLSLSNFSDPDQVFDFDDGETWEFVKSNGLDTTSTVNYKKK